MRPETAIETARLASGGILALVFGGVNGVVQKRCAPVVGAIDASAAETSAASIGMIEVALGRAVVRVSSEVDGKLLAKVLRAVKSVA